MANKNLADKVKKLRQQNAWSQSHLAEAAGLSVRTIQRLEKDGTCSRETLLSVASAFDIDVTQLTTLRPLQEVSSDQNAELLTLQFQDEGDLFSIRNWFSDRVREWQNVMAVAGGLLLVVPVSFFIIGGLKYSVGFDAMPNPYEVFYTTGMRLEIWNLVSPFLFLGSLLLALVLNLFPFLDLEIMSRDKRLLSSFRYQGNGWNRAIIVISLAVLCSMLGYVAVENIAEGAIRSFAQQSGLFSQ